MLIDTAAARQVLEEETSRAAAEGGGKSWAQRFERLAELSKKGGKTHIAALGTALLAKAVNVEVDVFALKRTGGGPRAYSARSLAKDVLAKEAIKLGIDIGVTGPEPLNNQPYFRESRITRDMPVRPNSRPALLELCSILELVDRIETEDQARAALRSFISVRLKRKPSYVALAGQTCTTQAQLLSAVEKFVSDNSEGGKRAQAVAAGMLDAIFGHARVVSGRINDPSRRHPGDVAVLTQDGACFERVLEVRDKPVALSDVLIFGRKCLEHRVSKAGVLSVAARQDEISVAEIGEWASRHGITLKFFRGWHALATDLIFWSPISDGEATKDAVRRIYDRLITMEVSETGVALWSTLTAAGPN